MLYWNFYTMLHYYISKKLHMYKCCIEMCLPYLPILLWSRLHMYKCCIEIIMLRNTDLKTELLHMYKCCIEINRLVGLMSSCLRSTCTNVVLKYHCIFIHWSCNPLHMYKCCIEIGVKWGNPYYWISSTCTNVVLKFIWCTTARFINRCSTCTNVVLKFDKILHPEKDNIAPHVQMLYWNPVPLLKAAGNPRSTCTNVVLKFSWIFVSNFLCFAPHVQMLYWNLFCWQWLCCWWNAPHVQMLYWNLSISIPHARCSRSTCTNVVLKYIFFIG